MGKTAFVLLLICLLVGGVRSGVWAEDGSETQIVVVLDFDNPAGDNQKQGLIPESVGLLVHLLGDHDYLGLVGSGKQDGVVLPTAKLDGEHRHQALDKLAHFTPGLGQRSFTQVLQTAFDSFQPEGPKRRVLFWLAGGNGAFNSQPDSVTPLDLRKIVAQARSAGIIICAGLTAPTSEGAGWQALTSDTGGRLWEVRNAHELHVPCLRLYHYLKQPQEAPISGSQVLLDKWVNQAILVMTRLDPEKGVVLTSPQKGRISKTTRQKTIQWVEGPSFDLIALTKPRPGFWSFTGARPDDCRVFLATELKLSAEGTPREIGEDEALLVAAALHTDKGTSTDPRLVAGTQFGAELQVKNAFLAKPLIRPGPDIGPVSTPGVRLGRFPPLHQEGEGTLNLMALGETFQRLLSLPITITKPWFQVTPRAREAPNMLPLSFKPDHDRRLEGVGGTVTMKSAQGGLVGAFIKPASGSEIIIAQSPGCQDYCMADLRLTGIAPGGRFLEIASGPLSLKTSERLEETSIKLTEKTSSEEKVQRTNPATSSPKVRRRWVWLALIALGSIILLASTVLMWRLRSLGDGSEDEEGFTSHKNILRLKAQVEALTKEKAELEGALNEKIKQFELLLEEKAELQAGLERIQKKYQENLRSSEELEQRLTVAEQEAKGVNQEYMALYARNPQEKDLLKKT